MEIRPSRVEAAAKGKHILKTLGTSKDGLAGKRVLDAGAGDMEVAEHLGKHAEVHSISISYPLWRKFGRVQKMDYKDMRYPDGHFDEVLFSNSFVGGHGGHEFPEGMSYDAKRKRIDTEESALRKGHAGFLEALRVTKPGGAIRIFPMFKTGIEFFKEELMPQLEEQGCKVEIQMVGARIPSGLVHGEAKPSTSYRVIIRKPSGGAGAARKKPATKP